MLGIAALSAALLGTGYAAMTDTLTIGGDVNTANFCVQFKGEPTPVSEAAKHPAKYEMTEDTGAKLEGKDGYGHIITFKADNLKPGVPLTYTATIENLSSIKAKFVGAQSLGIPADQKALAEQVYVNVTMKSKEKEFNFHGDLDGLVTRDYPGIILEPYNSNGTDDEATLEFTIELKPENKEVVQGPLDFKLDFIWEQTQAPQVNPQNE